MKNLLMIMFLSGLFSWEKPQQSEKIEILDVVAYKEAITKKNVQLVDVRTGQEYKKGHIKGALNIDFFQNDLFKRSFEKLNKDFPVYIYCRSGGRSRAATRKLIKMGFTKIYDLEGGYLTWKQNK